MCPAHPMPPTPPVMSSRRDVGCRLDAPRILHTHLLLAHITACISTGASLSRDIFPMTNISCLLTIRLFTVMAILHQGFLVLFLEAKTDVTNMSGADPSNGHCWKRGVKRFARCWGYIYQPISAVWGAYAGMSDGLREDGRGCEGYLEYVSDEKRDNLRLWFLGAQFVLITLLVLLLAIFLIPLVSSHWRGGTLAISYRRVVVRNAVCASLITLMIASRALVMIFVKTGTHCSRRQCSQLLLTMTAGIQALTLCFTEITIEIGFSSCIATCEKDGGGNLRPLTSGETPGFREAVVPTEATNSRNQPSWSPTRDRSKNADMVSLPPDQEPRPDINSL